MDADPGRSDALEHEVSILVLVERPFGRRNRRVSRTGSGRFQSLFWWRGHLDHRRRKPPLAGRAGFNPCFGGEAIWTCLYPVSACQPSVSILVLVERPFGPAAYPVWLAGFPVSILVLVERPFGPAARPTTRQSRPSFNPCFGGEAIWTDPARHVRGRSGVFQSLFWWRGHLDMAGQYVHADTVGFQSLFWWRGHLDYFVDSLTPKTVLFQSLFWWRGHLDTCSARS